MLTGTCHCGALGWIFDGMPESVTACNCTLCRRYGVLWIYDYEGERIKISGPSTVYTRIDRRSPALEIHFCGTCGCVTSWRGLKLDADGRRRIAVNLRLTEPGPVAHLPIDHFDGLDTFDDLPRDDRCVAHMWF
ncbi:MAG: GFA family protein [Hyphomicrobium sp.]